MTRTAFFDERCLWRVGQLHVATLLIGAWVQPPSGSGLAESLDTKRRLKLLVVLRDCCQRSGVAHFGFGECRGAPLPAPSYN
jgi:hypothetical protein